MANIYASDLLPERKKDSFMGAGFEAKLQLAEELGQELIVGEFCENSEWRLE